MAQAVTSATMFSPLRTPCLIATRYRCCSASGLSWSVCRAPGKRRLQQDRALAGEQRRRRDPLTPSLLCLIRISVYGYAVAYACVLLLPILIDDATVPQTTIFVYNLVLWAFTAWLIWIFRSYKPPTAPSPLASFPQGRFGFHRSHPISPLKWITCLVIAARLPDPPPPSRALTVRPMPCLSGLLILVSPHPLLPVPLPPAFDPNISAALRLSPSPISAYPASPRPQVATACDGLPPRPSGCGRTTPT